MFDLKKFFTEWQKMDRESRENLDVINGNFISLILFKLMSIIIFPIYLIFNFLNFSSDTIVKIIVSIFIFGLLYTLNVFNMIDDSIYQFVLMFIVFNPYFWLFLVAVVIYDLIQAKKE